MSGEKTTILKLKDTVTNPDGSPAKDATKENRSQVELSTLNITEITKNYPNLTVGVTLIGIINGRKNIENIEEASTLQRLLVKIRNKLQTGKGEWNIEKQEILDLKQVFEKADPKTINVNLHGQVYNKLNDLLLQVTS